MALAYIQLMPHEQRTVTDCSGNEQPIRRPPLGFVAIGIFLFFGMLMASLAATTLLWRGTPLDPVWILNPKAYNQLAPLAGTVGILFLLLAATLAIAGIGWFRRRLWAWRLAVAIIAIQVLGDLINLVRGDFFGGGTGVVIAGTLLFYLFRQRIRGCFWPPRH